MDQFRAHIAALRDPGYTVLPLPEIVAALRTGTALPDRTVGLSIDDAYLSAYENAWPLLKEAGFPFTLFVATDPVDKQRDGYMSWDQIREMAEAGVTIGSQSVTHPHMPTRSLSRNETELKESADRLAAELGVRPTLFAYPYGETSLAIMELTAGAGYDAAFGQHSGVANETSDRYYLPRFPINVNYGALDRFQRLIETLPLPIQGLSPRDPLLAGEGPGNPPNFGFTVGSDVGRIDGLACYHSDPSKISQFETLGTRVEVRFDAPFAAGRTRINCTLREESGRWRWFGMQYYTPVQ